MYSESDLDAAVQAGALSPESADAFRDYIATSRETPAVDEEHFRLLTGFNDIFVSIATLLMLLAAGKLGSLLGTLYPATANAMPFALSTLGGGLTVAVLAWGLAEYFTRKRRMALPSILLLLAFVGGVLMTLTGLQTIVLHAFGIDTPSQQTMLVSLALIALMVAGAAWLHWIRFMVPITVAAGAGALAATAIALVTGLVPGARDALFPMLLGAGVLLFAFAMYWDMSDRERRTRRSDVAFWLHLAAAPMIAHSLFHILGVFDADMSVGMAGVVLVLYIAFATLALTVDRRALLVSSLAYVLYALYFLFRQTGAVELGTALTGLVIGSALLTLSAFWQPMRRAMLRLLGPAVSNHLPPAAMIPAHG